MLTRVSLPTHFCPFAATGTGVCPATSVQTLAVSADGGWVAGLGRNGHSQQVLLLWEVHGLQRTCKVHCDPDVVVKTQVESMLADSVQRCSKWYPCFASC